MTTTTDREFHFLMPGDGSLQVDANRAARSDKPLLILGEQGTGKATLAHHIHARSQRRDKPFECFNCAGMAPERVTAELCGSDSNRPGVIRAADGGTLLLEDFCEASDALYPLLLMLLDDRTVRRPGSDEPVPVDVRVILSTDQDLKSRIGPALRRRIAAWPPLLTTPLRIQRRKKWLFFKRFVEACAATSGSGSPGRIDFLLYFFVLGYPWPGNAEELRHFAEYLVGSGFLRDGALLLDRDFRFFAAPANEGDGVRGGDSFMALGDRVAPDAVVPLDPRDSHGDSHSSNPVQHLFMSVVRELQTSEQAKRWRDLSKASPNTSGQWDYPLIGWRDPFFDSSETCARMGQEYSRALGMVNSRPAETPPGTVVLRSEATPWSDASDQEFVVPGRSDEDLAELVAFGLITGAIPDRDQFLSRVYASIVQQAPNKNSTVYQQLGVPKAQLDKLLGTSRPKRKTPARRATSKRARPAKRSAPAKRARK